MTGHRLASSTRTVEMIQILELNEKLATFDRFTGEHLLVRAEFLGLAGAKVNPTIIDRAASTVIPRQQRRNEALVLPANARLQSMLAAGNPTFPHLYGVFDDPDGDRPLPVQVHTPHLRLISSALQFRNHRWGV